LYLVGEVDTWKSASIFTTSVLHQNPTFSRAAKAQTDLGSIAGTKFQREQFLLGLEPLLVYSKGRGGALLMSEISMAPGTPVVVVGFDMPFWPLVRFLVKIALASIPAGIVIALFYMVLGWIYGAILIATHHTSLLR
jgi:hypothetical protein